MSTTWLEAHSKYNWTVDLSKYENGNNYPDFFKEIISPETIVQFEEKFKESLTLSDQFEVTGEVCFWKNYRTFQSRNRLTNRILDHLSNPPNWNQFINKLVCLNDSQLYTDFEKMRKAINQPKGFATPITFLSFYNPSKYPMIDKKIANWWSKNKIRFGYNNANDFSQRKDGWIQAISTKRSIQNWDAYLDWSTFCQDNAINLSIISKMDWRARDVEMAVWEAEKRGIKLDPIQ